MVNFTPLKDFDTLFANIVEEELPQLKSQNIRISYSQKGQFSSGIDDNICFVHTDTEYDPVAIYKQRVEKYNGQTDKIDVEQSAMRVLLLHVVFYGPDSDTLSAKLYEKLFTDELKEIFWENNIALIPDRCSVTRLNEKINERWWERNDVNVYFYNSVTLGNELNVITSADVIIKTDVEASK